jgi:iron complex transport system ATP-binding protein
MSIIEVSKLSFEYPGLDVLRNLSFEVDSQTFLAIAGPNGAGKSTLLNLLSRTLTPKSGSIRIDSAAIESYSHEALARKVAVVRQEFVPVFGFTVSETVSMARTPYLDAFGFEREADRKIVAEAIEMTDTAQFAARTLAELSGGERQRVFIARALAQDTAILLLDEPTSFLDLKHQVAIYDLLKRMQLEKGKTIVVVTHDINLAAQYCDKSLLIGADDFYDIGSTENVFSAQRIEKVFGVRTFAGKVGERTFFLPLGKFAKDAHKITTDFNNTTQK